MTDIFTLPFISALVGIALTCILSSALCKGDNRYSWRRPGKYVTWAMSHQSGGKRRSYPTRKTGDQPYRVGAALAAALLVILSACGGSASSNVDPPQSSTPQTVQATSKPTATPTRAATASTDWTTYHANNQRTGYIASTPDPHSLSKIWSMQLDGAVYAEPLVVGNHVIVATEGDSLYALDPATGSVQWHTNVGTPVPLSSLPCGDIDPLGITGTPVYDPATNLVFAVAEVSGPAHMLVGVDVNTGKLTVERSVDIDGMDPRAHQERAALTLANGMVYITYGGLDGDCSDYVGRVVASQTNGQGPLLVYRVPTTREAGIWATPGASVDSAGNLYVSVGNGAATGGQWDHSDSVLKFSPNLVLIDAFAPSTWPQENANDQDLGSQGAVLLPNNFVFADGKSGKGYILKSTHLGGIGGQVDEQSTCDSFGGAATVKSTIFVPCTSGLLQITVDSNGIMHLGWQASSNIVGSPVVGGHTVYSLSNGSLYALNMTNGQAITSLNVGTANRFATPTISGTTIFVGTLGGITAVKIS